jgi:hypothetical protein
MHNAAFREVALSSVWFTATALFPIMLHMQQASTPHMKGPVHAHIPPP